MEVVMEETNKNNEIKGSAVDVFFDKATTWTAHGLTAARKGLEVAARWLDGRARAVGALADKLASKPQPSEPKTDHTQPA
jgi:hypothetical protein